MLFHHKLRSSSSPSLLFRCFHDGHDPAAAAYHETSSSDCDDGGYPRKVCSAALELPLPEIQYRCRSLIARIGRCRWRPGHAAGAAAASSEFGYDLMSYALNLRTTGAGSRTRSSQQRTSRRGYRCLRIGCYR